MWVFFYSCIFLTVAHSADRSVVIKWLMSSITGCDLQSSTTERQRSMYFRRQTSRNETFFCQLLDVNFSHGKERVIRLNGKQSNLLLFANWRSVKICENIPGSWTVSVPQNTRLNIRNVHSYSSRRLLKDGISPSQRQKMLNAVNEKRKNWQSI